MKRRSAALAAGFGLFGLALLVFANPFRVQNVQTQPSETTSPEQHAFRGDDQPEPSPEDEKSPQVSANSAEVAMAGEKDATDPDPSTEPSNPDAWIQPNQLASNKSDAVSKSYEELFFDSSKILTTNTGEVAPDGSYEKTMLVQPERQLQKVLVREKRRTGPAGDELLERTTLVADQLVVRPKNGVSRAAFETLATKNGFRVIRKLYGSSSYLVEVDGKSFAAIEASKQRFLAEPAMVEHAEPDYLVFATGTPNDPRYGELWGLHNIGQEGGLVDADIDAPEGWNLGTGSSDVLVGVIDTGVDYTHPDLAPNMWRNPREQVGDANSDGCPGVCNTDDDGDGLVDEDFNGCGKGGLDKDGNACTWSAADRNGCLPSGVDAEGAGCTFKNELAADDDENGFNDDIRGWNFASNTNDPLDDFFHGTHCAGTIGAVGGNGQGVVGVNWNVRIAAIKFLAFNGSGTYSAAAEAVRYATSIGVDLTSNSWGGSGTSVELEDAIREANEKGQLFIAAAGNSGKNTDTSNNFPSNYDIPNVVSVAATNRNDQLASFSNFGAVTVDLGAPGVDILSTMPTFRTYAMDARGDESNYGLLSGTSMATPHVAGAAALLKSLEPELTQLQIKQRLLGSVDAVAALQGKTVTGGRLNLRRLVGAGNATVFVDTLSIDDSLGNNDGQLNPGETVRLGIALTNTGGAPAVGVTGTLALRTPVSGVTILSGGPVAYGTISPTASVARDSFSLVVGSSVDTPLELPLTLTVQDSGGGSFTANLALKVVDGYAVSGSVTLDGQPVPNVTVRFTGRYGSGEVVTNAQGTYSVFVEDGEYEFSTGLTDYSRISRTLSVPSSQLDSDFAFVTQVEGSVTDIADGSVVSDPTVKFTRAGVPYSLSGDATGHFSLILPKGTKDTLSVRAIAPGRYFPSRTKTIIGGDQTQTIELKMHLGAYEVVEVASYEAGGFETPIGMISDDGTAVGSVIVGIPQPNGSIRTRYKAFRWRNGVVDDLGLDPSGNATAISVADDGTVLGTTLGAPVLVRDSGLTSLETPPNSTGFSIFQMSKNGLTIGNSTNSAVSFYGADLVVWDPAGAVSVLGRPNPSDKDERVVPIGINANGQIVGAAYMSIDDETAGHAYLPFFYDNGEFKTFNDIMPENTYEAYLQAATTHGTLVGHRKLISGTEFINRAFYIGADRVFHELPLADMGEAGPTTALLSVNDVEQGVGLVSTYQYPNVYFTRAATWNEGNGYTLLSETFAEANDWESIYYVSTINSSGWMGARGVKRIDDKQIGSALVFRPNRSIRVDAESRAVPRGGFRRVMLSSPDARSKEVYFKVLKQPAHGTLAAVEGTLNMFDYMPNAGFDGDDSFVFAASEGPLVSNAAVLTLQLSDVTDDDNDGTPENEDNCPGVHNPLQADLDNDGLGDACDPDSDGDLVTDDIDCAPNDPNLRYDGGYVDTDRDGIRDSLQRTSFECRANLPDGIILDENGPDNCRNVPNPDQLDSDGDGEGDACEGLGDADGDGVRDGNDNCPNVPNADQRDSNGNGIGDLCEDIQIPILDFDGDMLSDLGTYTTGKSGMSHTVMLSSSKSTQVVEFGASKNTYPAYGDYNGDGTTDIAVVEVGKRSLTWRVDIPQAEALGLAALELGKPGDTLLTNCDFDGDMRSDPAVLTRKNTLMTSLSRSNEALSIKIPRLNRKRLLDVTCADLDGEGQEILYLVGSSKRSVFRGASIKGVKLFERKLKKVQSIAAGDILGNAAVRPVYFSKKKGRKLGVNFIEGTQEATLGLSVPKFRTAIQGRFRADDGTIEDGVYLLRKQTVEALTFADGQLKDVPVDGQVRIGKRKVKVMKPVSALTTKKPTLKTE